MKYVKQFSIILFISLLGEVLHAFIPLPVPASIYGIVLMFLALEFKLIKISSIRETSAFLLDIMPLMFVPPGVGLLAKWDVVRPVLLPFVCIVLISTVAVIAVSGRVTQRLIRIRNKKE